MKTLLGSKITARASVMIGLLIIMSGTMAKAQTDDENYANNKFSMGFSGGLNFPWMVYSDPNISAYGSSLMAGVAIGAFAEINLSKFLSVRPELVFIGKGQAIDNATFNYRIAPYYFDWRLPFLLNFGKPSGVRPYLMMAPSIGFTTAGDIYLQEGGYEYQTDLTDGNISIADITFTLGAGLKMPIKMGKSRIVAGLEMSYGIGLTDTYSSYEQEGSSVALNAYNYSIDGTRKNRGVAFTASLAIPFSNFKTDKKKPIKIIEEKKQGPQVEKTATAEPVKSCYTVEEINALIDAKKNVHSKVICMDNLNFEFNKSVLDKASKAYLDNVLTLLKKVSTMKMKISGHTDNVGSLEYNMELSKKRASAVCDYLISKGVAKERLSYEYYGSSRPLFPNDSDANRAKNRRVEFEIIEK
jgi:outer membrane protein OmpA-like peptidoglycan-associated protein